MRKKGNLLEQTFSRLSELRGCWWFSYLPFWSVSVSTRLMARVNAQFVENIQYFFEGGNRKVGLGAAAAFSQCKTIISILLGNRTLYSGLIGSRRMSLIYKGSLRVPKLTRLHSIDVGRLPMRKWTAPSRWRITRRRTVARENRGRCEHCVGSAIRLDGKVKPAV